MKTYDSLSKLPFLKKYSYKFLFVAFLGIHIPLLGILFYTMFVSNITTTTIVLVVLGLTLGATGLTLMILNNLLEPIIKGEKALKDYVQHNTVPDLPTTYNDEVGEVLKNIQFTIECLDEVDKERQSVTELISHDLRTPVLQSIEIIKFLKEEGDDPEKRLEHLNTLSEIAVKQNNFLKGMLKILKAKHVEVSLNKFNTLLIREVIDKVVKGCKTSLEAKQLKVINTFPKDVKLNCHALGMKQVFENLLSNAIKFSENEGEIHISGSSENRKVKIQIKDQGTGFNAQTKSVLFSKFVPGHLGTHGEPTTGLGLYLTKKIVEKHGGVIEPFSDGHGKGAKFVVSIPA